MRVRSTGLGKSEMTARIDTMESKAGYLILHIRSTAPVLWHIRGAVTYKEVYSILWMLIKRGIIKYILFGWATKNKTLTEF